MQLRVCWGCVAWPHLVLVLVQRGCAKHNIHNNSNSLKDTQHAVSVIADRTAYKTYGIAAEPNRRLIYRPTDIANT